MKAMFWLQGAIEFFDEKGVLNDTVDVFWFINHYVTHCRAHNIPINKALFL
jgi:2,4'-dihydroxyacetophenone dioxygenase